MTTKFVLAVSSERVSDVGLAGGNINSSKESQTTKDESEETKVDNSEDANSDDGIDDLINELNENKGHKDGILDNIRNSNKEKCGDQNMEKT
nr:hypothetical protein [Tanacetum cinerariifolium]